MSVSTEKGTMKHWFNGLPFIGVQKGSLDAGTNKYWFNGLPGDFLFPSGVISPATTATIVRIYSTTKNLFKKINRIVYSTIKKITNTKAN